MWCEGSWFPDQGLNLGPLHWKHGVLAPGMPGKSSSYDFKFHESYQFLTPLFLRDIKFRGLKKGETRNWWLGSVVRQAPLSMEFSRPEYWSGLPFPSPGDLPNPGIKPVSPAWEVNSLPLSHLESPNTL